MQAISDKIAGTTHWLAQNPFHPENAQKHLDEGTPEQAYWHYGYLCALRDVASVIKSRSTE